MKSMRFLTVACLVIAVVAAGLVVWGCGGKKAAEESTQTPTAQTESAPAAGSDTGEVSLAVGDRVYQERCEMCHGPDGMGDGPAGQALNPRPRNYHDVAYMSTLTDSMIADRILNGKPGTGMPPHKGLLTDAEVKSLVLKVRSFAKQ